MNKKNTFVIEFENDGDKFEYCKEFFEVNGIPVQEVTQEQGNVSYKVEGSRLAESLRELNQIMEKITEAAPREEIRAHKKDLKKLKRVLGE